MVSGAALPSGFQEETFFFCSGRRSYNNVVTVTDVDTSSGTYTLCYMLDEAFLTAEDTRFPVTASQAVHLYQSKQPDTSVYSAMNGLVRHYLSPYLLLGDTTIKGEGWSYIRYETLYDLDIPADKIRSATYTVRNLFDLPKKTVIGLYAATADWCSINTTWTSRPSFEDQRIASVEMKGKGDYSFDVTELLRQMINNKGIEEAAFSVRNGFLLRSDTPESDVMLASGDGGLFSPVLTVVLENP